MDLQFAFLVHMLLLFGVDEGISENPFIDRKEASRFLDRTKRSNSFWEEVKAGNQERECIEEDCTMEEAFEVFDNQAETDKFWQKYLRCNQALPRRYKQRGRIRIARQSPRRNERQNSELRACIKDEDQCNPFPCVHSNTAECVDSINSFQCVCKNGFTGRKCENPVNECLSNPCQNSGRCEDEIGGFSCVCDSNHEGTLCEIEVNDCRNTADKECYTIGGSCQQRGIGEPYLCVCNLGYEGVRCERDVDECQDPSSCEQECHNTVGSFTCSCRHGFLLDTNTRTTCKDIDECKDVAHGCTSQRHCHNTPGSFHCSCDRGYQLDKIYQRYCDDIDECAVNNGGCPTIEEGCGLDRKPCQTCNNYDGGFNCYCPVGFGAYREGGDCTDINECDTSYHGCEQECENYPGGFRCLCSEGFKLSFNGKKCSDINECLEDHGCSYRCINSVGSYSCTCRRGFELDEDQRTCIDKDECFLGESNCNQTCINTDGGYKCGCKPGYRLLGKYKCSEINECYPRPCGKNGRCIDQLNGFECECYEGFSGETCDVITDPCSGDPCLNGGTCSVIDTEFYCQCPRLYLGVRCQDKDIGPSCDAGYRIQNLDCVDIDECEENTASCQQTCQNNQGSYTCSCDAGYTLNGNNCEDINECEDNPCQQICRNLVGSYECACNDGYTLNDDGRTCETSYMCVGKQPPILASKHMLLGIRKNDYVVTRSSSSDSSIRVGFEFRTFDRDGILVAVLDRELELERNIYLLLIDGQLTLAANLDWTNKITKRKGVNMADGQWHDVTLRKRRNRVMVLSNGERLLKLDFQKNRFGTAGYIYYGGIPSNVTAPSTLRDADMFLQGCLKTAYTWGMTVDVKDDSVHSGCFESIENGMYFDGSGYLRQNIELQSNLGMRFNFKSYSPNGIIIFAQDSNDNEFSVTIDGNQLIASLTTSNGETYSSVYTSDQQSLCDEIWHACHVTITSDRVQFHVDGVATEPENISTAGNIQFNGDVSIYMGGRQDDTSNSYKGNMRSVRINNQIFDVDNIEEMNGVRLYSMPS